MFGTENGLLIESKTFEEVAFLTREEVQMFHLATRSPQADSGVFFVPFSWLVVVFWVSVVVSLVSFAASVPVSMFFFAGVWFRRPLW
jgi:hypothetical protein